MRQRRLIENTCPCDFDFHDKSVQTIADARATDRVMCSNIEQCNARNIQCTRRLAQQVAEFIIDRHEPYAEAVQNERRDLERDPTLNAPFWVFRDGEWKVVQGGQGIVDEIMAFAEVIIDFQLDENSPPTRDMENSHPAPA
ncbi:hypothetical protein HQ571_05610 [Candidatus Kuenenbacteria bacterium]|nr:hypothetical protein [Candidatus Kuenenbacteria bacterium]